MSNFEFLLFILIFNSLVLIGLIQNSIKKKSPRILIKFFFLPILLSTLVSIYVQSYMQISEVNNRQLLANFLIAVWCLKTFNTYKSIKALLLDNFLQSLRDNISKKKFFRLIIMTLKISFLQILCFSSVFSLNYLSGYSVLNIIDILGLAFCTAGLILEFLCEKEIKQSPDKKEAFIQSGPWSYIQHPNMAAIILFFMGLQILSLGAVGSSWSLLSVLAIIYIVYKKLIPEIEKKLSIKYPQYNGYSDRVPNLFSFNKKR